LDHRRGLHLVDAIGGALLVGVFSIALMTDSARTEDLLIQTMLWIGLAASWNIVGGFAYQFSLGHSVFLGIGAYTSTYLFIHGVSPWLGVFVGIAISLAVSLPVGAVTLRMQGHNFALATLAMGFVGLALATSLDSITGGGVGLSAPLRFGWEWMTFREKTPYIFIMFGYAVVTLLVSAMIRRSRLGYSLIAYREDVTAAEAVGIRTTKAKILALLISAGLTATGGTLMAQYILFIDPSSVAGPFRSVEMALLSIVGGLGTVTGPVFGSVLIRPLSEWLRATIGTVFDGAPGIVFGVLLIAVLFTLPRGVAGLVEDLIGRWRR